MGRLTRTVLLSVKPVYADQIFALTKTVELRKRRPNLVKGDSVLVYVSAPVMELRGAFSVAGVHSEAPESLWVDVGATCGLRHTEFLSYFENCACGSAIYIDAVREFHPALSLSSLRDSLSGFHPPQSYMYLSEDALSVLPV